MTKAKIISFIKRDIKKLEREQKKLQDDIGHLNDTRTHRLDYYIARKHTLKEILKMM